MSTLEDDIRDALRDEATRLREVRPLRLAPADAPRRLGPVTWHRRARHLRPWLAPVTAAALVVTLAISLVALHAPNKEASPAAPQSSAQSSAPLSAGPSVAPPASQLLSQIPPYNVGLGDWDGAGNGFTHSYVVSDSRSGATVGTVTAPKGTEFYAIPAAVDGDGQAFVVGATIADANSVEPFTTTGPVGWYRAGVSPGSARPVRVTRLPIPAAVTDLPVVATGLSADGRYLAVGFGSSGKLQEELRVYEVATGRLAGNWTMTTGKNFGRVLEIRGLHWVNGDSTIAITLWSNTITHEEVRTVALRASGGDLLAASHAVWSQDVPAPAHGEYSDTTPLLCGTPFLTADGHTVVCAGKSYSAADKITTLELLAYPLATPTTPHVLGSFRITTSATPFRLAAVWADPSGRTAIGYWGSLEQFGPGQTQWVGAASGGTFGSLPYGASLFGGYLAF